MNRKPYEEWYPRSLKEGFVAWALFVLLLGSTWIGFKLGGWYWFVAAFGIMSAFIGFWKMETKDKP